MKPAEQALSSLEPNMQTGTAVAAARDWHSVWLGAHLQLKG